MHVAYIPAFDYPADSSSGLRMSGVARAMVLGGIDVTIASAPPSSRVVSSQVPAGVRAVARTAPTRRGIVGRVLTAGGDIVEWLDGLESRPDAVMLYGTDSRYLLRLRAWCRTNRVPLLCDIVEWYDARHLPLGRFAPHAVSNELSMRHWSTKIHGCLTISELLSDHYARRGVRNLVVPPLFDVPTERPVVPGSTDGVTRVGYVGIPGRKDAATFDNLIRLAHEWDDASHPIEIHLAGPARDTVAALLSSREAEGRVVAHGALTHDRALEVVARSDFTVLQRPSEKYANAGFPSKVVESLVAGVPVLANVTSDLGAHLTDGVNALLLEDESYSALCTGVQRASHVDTMDRRAIAEAARTRYSPESWSGAILKFLDDLGLGA